MDKNTVYKRTLSQAKERLTIVQEQEKEFNKQVSNNNKQIKQISIKNKKLAKKISSHMKYMNQLVSEITEKSKKEEPQWEILEVTDKAGKIWERYFYNGDPHICGNNYEYVLQSKIGRIFDIKTVKRFPDNTVWSVGMVTGQGKIKKFQVIGENMLAEVYETCYAFNIDLLTEAPKEEQVPIKVEIMEFGYGKPQENKGKFYVANFNLPNNAKLPTEKYQSIKSAIEDVLNGKTEYGLLVATGNIESYNKGYSMGYKDANKYNDKKYSESELLQARRDAFDAAREGELDYSITRNPISLSDAQYIYKNKYKDNEDYINSLK